MVKTAQFEEKTYEKYFGHELSGRFSNSFSPGQRAEFSMGFDEAFDLPWWIFFYHFRYLMKSPWGALGGIGLQDLDHIAEEVSKDLPPYRFNFFVQYKRPDYVEGHRGGEWPSWQQPYFRYAITAHQQLALEKLHSASSGRAAVIYASPAFWTSDKLFETAAKKQVIKKSNIAKADALTGHGRYSYVAEGGVGVAHSEPEEIRGPTFEKLIELAMDQPKIPFRDHVLKAAGAIERSLDEDRSRATFEKAKKVVISDLVAENIDIPSGGIVSAILTIEAFCDAFAVEFYAVG